jgi:hypothetical protein
MSCGQAQSVISVNRESDHVQARGMRTEIACIEVSYFTEN